MRCEDKKAFATSKEALRFVRQGSKNLKKKVGRVRAYHCPVCKKFHLTTKSRF